MVNLDEDFAQVWAVYLRRDKKIASKDALKWALQNHNGDGQLIAKILAAITWQSEVQPEWRYWTSLDRWLLARRWEDDPPIRTSPGQAMRDAKHEAAKAQQIEYWRQKQGRTA